MDKARLANKVVIVGGVAGGASAAARLRRLDEHARIVIIERGPHISFANCGLPYWVGGEIEARDELVLQTPRGFGKRFRVDVRVRHEAVRIEREARLLHVRDLTTGEEYAEPYDTLVLATGAEPLRPELSGLDLPGVFTLRSIPDAERIRAFLDERTPGTALVVGGGFIGLEMAENLQRRGVAVTVVDLADQLLPPLDYDMACEAADAMRRAGVRLLLGNAVRAITRDGDHLRVTLSGGEIHAQLVVLGMGVRPESALASEAGLAMAERGMIRVDAHMRTSDERIYAVGDAALSHDLITGRPAFVPLAGQANKQGRIAADNICGIASAYRGTQGSAIVRLFDSVAAVTGINERAARREGIAYEKSYTYSMSHAGYFPGARGMSVKLLYAPGTGKLLGAQIVGHEGVDKRIDVLATAIRAGMDIDALTELELCYAPPYSSAKDPVNMAGYAAQNALRGLVKNVHWHDIEAIRASGAQCVDVRTPREYARGTIDGFRNVPLDELRERLGELNKDRPVYVTCQVGQRGYLACRVLTQHGFDCYNLSGGVRLYDCITKEYMVK